MDETTQQMISNAAHALVSEIAPQEMPLFGATSAAYFRNPRRALRGHLAKDEMLGFGGGENATFLTPIILIAATQIAELAAPTEQEAPKRGLSGLFGGFGNKAKKPAGTVEGARLRPEQLPQARELAVKILRESNVPEAQIDRVADALIRQFAPTT
jgi:hypothetical protein